MGSPQRGGLVVTVGDRRPGPTPTPGPTPAPEPCTFSAAHTATTRREAPLTVAGATVTIARAAAPPPPVPPCTYTATPTEIRTTLLGGTFDVAIEAGSTCAWTAASQVDGITVNGAGNRAVRTDDFQRDAAAAEATRETVTRLLAAELATQPPGLSSVGFTYRFNSSLGTVERTSGSFGAFFTERSLTAGKGQAALGVNLRLSSYQSLDGRDLRDGRFLTTANQFRDERMPFDEETLTLELATNERLDGHRHRRRALERCRHLDPLRARRDAAPTAACDRASWR